MFKPIKPSTNFDTGNMVMTENPRAFEPRRLNTTGTNLIVVDGLVGGGKGLIAPIVCSFSNVNPWIVKPEIEQILYLHRSSHITREACEELLKTWIDIEAINYMLGREVNLKLSDYSSVWKQGRFLEYCRNSMSNSNSDEASDKLSKRPVHVCLMTHAIASHSRPLFNAFNERLTFVRVTRHPCTIYLLQHLLRWLNRWRHTPSNGLISLRRKKSEHFTHPDLAFSFDSGSYAAKIDEVIDLLWAWQVSGDSAIDESNLSAKGKILEVCYEKFVFEPMPVIQTLSTLIREPISGSVLKELNRQGVPRRSLTDAPTSAVYRRLGWSKPNSHRLMHDEFQEALAWAKSQGASREFLDKYQELAVRYENRHGLT